MPQSDFMIPNASWWRFFRFHTASDGDIKVSKEYILLDIKKNAKDSAFSALTNRENNFLDIIDY